MQQIRLSEISIDVILKDIKNIHLSVHPPTGRVRISAPARFDLDTIRIFALSKINWIRKHRTGFKKQEREAKRDYITQESHYFLGKRFLLKVIEEQAPPRVVRKHNTIELYVRKTNSAQKKQEILTTWYRQQLKQILPKYISKWEDKMDVRVSQHGIRKMKTRWGTCNRESKRIWFNLELAKKPPQCLEYIVVHEMVHLLERKHNERFKALMDKYMPQWRLYKEELNRFPLSHAEWKY